MKRDVANCEAMKTIRTKKECVQAAEQVGLIGKISMNEIVTGSYTSSVDGCFYDSWLQQLYLNSNGITDSTDERYKSLCKKTATGYASMKQIGSLESVNRALKEALKAALS